MSGRYNREAAEAVAAKISDGASLVGRPHLRALGILAGSGHPERVIAWAASAGLRAPRLLHHAQYHHGVFSEMSSPFMDLAIEEDSMPPSIMESPVVVRAVIDYPKFFTRFEQTETCAESAGYPASSMADMLASPEASSFLRGQHVPHCGDEATDLLIHEILPALEDRTGVTTIRSSL